MTRSTPGLTEAAIDAGIVARFGANALSVVPPPAQQLAPDAPEPRCYPQRGEYAEFDTDGRRQVQIWGSRRIQGRDEELTLVSADKCHGLTSISAVFLSHPAMTWSTDGGSLLTLHAPEELIGTRVSFFIIGPSVIVRPRY